MPARSRPYPRVCPAIGAVPARGDLGRALSSAYRRAIERYLQEIGVGVVLSFSPTPTLVTQIDKGEIDMAAFAWLGGIITTGAYCCGAEQNVTGYCQRLVTADLNQADRILDEGQRARALNRVDRRLANDVPVIPLYQTPGITAYRATIRNVGRSAADLANAENWWLAE